MITELLKRNETYLVVLIEKNKSVNLNELVEKILKKQKEPFSKIYVVLMPMMIPAVLSDDWTKFNSALSNLGRTTKSLAESGDWMAFSADVKSAFDKLNEREKALVHLFYGEQVDGSELQEKVDQDKSQKAVMMEANRAVNKMVKTLGGNPPHKDEDYTE